MTENVTYTVETLSSAFAGRIPWDSAMVRATDGLTERQAIKLFNEERRSYTHNNGSGWSGHVRIVGSDDWTYEVGQPEPGERSGLFRVYHLDDI